MSAVLNDEHKALSSAVRRLLREAAGSEQMRAAIDSPSGYDRRLWDRLAQELGLHGLALATDHDGSGASLFEQVLVLEEMGGALLGSPYLPTVVLAAATLMCVQDDPVAKELLPRIADGSLTAAVAFTATDGSWRNGANVTAESY